MNSQLIQTIESHLEKIYEPPQSKQALDAIVQLLGPQVESEPTTATKWSESDTILITYGDSLQRQNEKPLDSLRSFLLKYLKNEISIIHILPFFEFSSDDGFAVIDYRKVNRKLGDWPQVRELSEHFDLMYDFVINHVSSQSEWFQAFLRDEAPYNKYFIVADEDTFDTSQVVRPRSSPLFAEFSVKNKVKKVWATFSHDQLDLDFENTEVLLEFIKILKFYLEQGARLIRLDAVGFLFKESGTSCMHLPRTHQAIKLLRDIAEVIRPDAVIITETNVPNQENLSYFGNRNEAHMIYNFSLPPLVLHALLTGRVDSLKSWMMSMPPALPGCCYLNFTASHDGVGLRPLEGLVSTKESQAMLKALENFGGLISYRSQADGSKSPYEVNISLFDACQGTVGGKDKYQIDRFLCSQIIMMGVEGIPAFYIHSFTSTQNDYEGVKLRGHNRAINRHQWNLDQLENELEDANTTRAVVFHKLKSLVNIRKKQRAFHPNATQFTLHLGKGVFAFWRQSPERDQSIFCIHNVTTKKIKFNLADLNLVITDSWADLISGERFNTIHQQVILAPYECMWISNKFT